jgi:RNA polymerase sigma-70 factor (ECF subfamily)
MKAKSMDLSLQDDLTLIKLSIKGNMRAFEVIVKRYESMVARVTISMLGKDAAEDVGQDVFIRFYKSMDKFKGDSKLGTYLTRIAINLSLNEIKKRSKYHTSMDEDEVYRVSDEYDTENKNDINQTIRYALSQLETEFRSVILLRSIEGYSTKETADILELPQGTVLSRFSRGQQKLKDIITKLNIL